MDKDTNKKLNKIREKFIANDAKEKKIKDKERKEKTKENIVMFILVIVYFWIAIFIASLGYLITNIIWFIMIIFWLWYLCISYDD